MDRTPAPPPHPGPGRPPGPDVAPARAGLAATLAAGLVLALAGPGGARAQPAGPEDWPCVQVLVPEVRVETLWPVAIDPESAARWREDAPVAALARRFAALEDGDEGARAEAEAALAAFVAGADADGLAERLSALAAATVELVDARRAGHLDGIRRFTRQQIRLAERLESALNELATAPGAEPAVGADAIALARAGSGGRRDEAEEALRWQERLYDQRERQVRALCERPVRLEEGLARSVRAFADALPDAG